MFARASSIGNDSTANSHYVILNYVILIAAIMVKLHLKTTEHTVAQNEPPEFVGDSFLFDI